MKINRIMAIPICLLMLISIVGCNKTLDKKPFNITPESFFQNQSQLEAYVISQYILFPVAGGFDFGPSVVSDTGSDDLVSTSGRNFWRPGELKVTARADNWKWESIRTINYFFENVLPKLETGEISGTMSLINHNLGEMYFFRAFEYFKKLKAIGDCPILLETIPDQLDLLLKASVRQPRNKVARQILLDLDLAIDLLQENHSQGNNRINKNVARLFKSRVALYEGSWELNFKGTAFVPNGDGWPGKATHPDFVYDAQTEIDFFLDQAIEASKTVAEAITLAENPAVYNYKLNLGNNPYFDMFASTGTKLKSVGEVLLYKSYDQALGVSHNMQFYLIQPENGTGYSNQLMQNFLMANGLPIYAPGSEYQGDETFEKMKSDRDNRFQLFVQAPGEILNKVPDTVSKAPNLLTDTKTTTGYAIKKRMAIDAVQFGNGGSGTTGDIIFRGVEAYLNYMEAYYLRHNAIGGNIDKYWKAIRKRANVDDNYMKTINATDMSKEAKVDLAAYTAGELISTTLYNIRRERRLEFVAEGFRFDDLKRYRALDQLISSRVFIPQGMNLWANYSNVKTDEHYDGNTSKFIQAPDAKSNVSKNETFTSSTGEEMEGTYVYPYRIKSNNAFYNGYKFAAAHYLQAIGATDIIDGAIGENADDAVADNSVIYQNPGWGNTVGGGAQSIAGFN